MEFGNINSNFAKMQFTCVIFVEVKGSVNVIYVMLHGSRNLSSMSPCMHAADPDLALLRQVKIKDDGWYKRSNSAR